MRYVVITPVKNEAAFIQGTLESMIRQSVLPLRWIIVDDASSDDTSSIVERYCSQHDWIRLVQRDDNGARERGGRVVKAFYDGYDTVRDEDFEVVVKLDGDLTFGPDYFELLLARLQTEPTLGITGGAVYERLNGSDWVLRSAIDHVRGPTKVYRRTCFDAIGGLAASLGWDGLDEWKARALGWKVEVVLQAPLMHYRVTGAATGSLRSRVELGYGAHFMGYHPLFMLTRSIRHMFKPPYLVGGCVMLGSYVAANLRGRARCEDAAVIRYVRREQLRQVFGLFLGKPVHRWPGQEKT